MKTGNIKFYLISRSNPKIPGSSRWKLDIKDIQNISLKGVNTIIHLSSISNDPMAEIDKNLS